MDAWTTEFWYLLNGLMGNPSGTMQTAVFRIVGFFVMIFTFEFAGHGMGANKQIGLPRVILAFVVGMLVTLVAFAAARLYLLPLLPDGTVNKVVLYGVSAAAVLLIAVPLQCLIRKSKYVSMAVSFVSSFIVVYLIIFALNAALGSILAGGKSSESIRERKHMTEGIIPK